MKNLLFAGISLFFALAVISCDVDQTQEGEMPEVDVDVEEGRLPAFDIDWADVDVKTTTRMVKIPKVRVVMEEEEIEVPVIDVNMPDEGEMEERTILVQADVNGQAHDLDIKEVHAKDNRLYVISQLEGTGEDLGEEVMRVSDRVVLNAPDLDIRHYIIGERPSGEFNTQYTYVKDRAAISSKLEGAKKIY